MLIFISLGIHFSTAFQFFKYFEQLVGSYENVLLKYRKETNIVCFSYIIGCVFILIKIQVIYGLYKYKRNIRGIH